MYAVIPAYILIVSNKQYTSQVNPRLYMSNGGYLHIVYLLEELPKCINGFDISIPDKLLPWSDELPDSLRKHTAA